ncbi:MAG: BON domain-containing protein [Acidobacteria bacterium]|nr:BON domain-containing protein [Acidobacteriota bacterium]
MSRRIERFRAAAVLPLAFAAWAGCGPAAASSARIEDAVLTGKVKTAILLNRHVDWFRINVDTDGGVVTLKGLVRDGPQRDLAGAIAGSVEGVARVRNDLRVDQEGEEPPPPEDRTLTQKFRDASIVAAVKSSLLLRKGIRADRIRVESTWGIVTLEGVVGSEEERQLVLSAVEGLRMVRAVRDHLDRIPGTPERSSGGG